MLKIGIIGPESTGKSTLSHYLSNRYAGLLVPEYARVYLEERARECGHAYAYTREDVLKIAEYQVQQLSELYAGVSEGIPKGCRRDAENVGGVLDEETIVFFDTELIITKIWLMHKYGECPAFIEEALRKYPMDVYLLCYPDLPWEPDPVRENPDIREYLFDWYEREIQALDTPYYIIRHLIENQ